VDIFKETFIDRVLIQFILIIYVLAYFIDFIGVLLIEGTTGSSSMAEMGISEIVLRYIFTFFIKLFFLLFAIYITTRIIEERKAVLKSFFIHLLLASILSFYTAALGMVASKYLFNGDTPITGESIWVRGINGLSYNFFVYVAIMSIVYAYYYLNLRKQEAVKQEQLKTQLLDSKINALQSQLHPHFLFNALNDISALMDINIQKSQDAIADLSDLLRHTLQIKDSKFIPLAKELEILQKYLDIERLRFGDKLHISQEIDDDIKVYHIPPLILQPLIENAIKHGFSYDHDVLRINIKIVKQNNDLKISIQNDGALLKDNDQIHFGTGITNVLERLNSLYDGHYTFEMKNMKQHGKKIVEVCLLIPISQ
jgi:sensor histidine kinase YesM